MMKIKLSNKLNGKDFFFDKILRDYSKYFRSDDIEKLEFNISNIEWFNDFQMSTFPFLLDHIKRHYSKTIEANYFIPGLFTEDKNFDYLYSCGFFDFIKNLGMKVNLSRECNNTPANEDPFVHFQSFQNLSKTKLYNQDFWYNLTASLSQLTELFKNEIFKKTDIAEKLTKTITKELIENINQHSKATCSLVRFRYEKDSSNIKEHYSDEWFQEYFVSFKNTPFFILTVSDNGEGIIQTLKGKYLNSKIFVPGKEESLREMEGQANSWWLERAFGVHDHAKNLKRSRSGLSTIQQTVEDYNGLLFVRTHDSALYNISPNRKPKRVGLGLGNPFISGTHYAIYLPAIKRKQENILKTKLYVNSKLLTISGISKYRIEHIDINYNTKAFPLSDGAEASHDYSKLIIESIVKKLDIIINTQDNILEIDFSNAFNARIHDYIYILDSIYKMYGNKFSSRTILRNLSWLFISSIYSIIPGKKFLKSLSINNDVLLAFDTYDNAAILGDYSHEVVQKINNIVSGDLIHKSELNDIVAKIVANNNFILSFKTIEGYTTALSLPFKEIFKNDFEEKIKKELAKSKSIVDGHFLINDSLHVDRYLIAHLMFQNPIVCRGYAMQIVITLNKKIHDILLSYSTTGIILYWYLKTYYYHDLKLSLIKSPNDIRYEFGEKIAPGNKVLIVTDVMATGTLMKDLKSYAINATNDSDSVIGQLAIFRIGTNSITDDNIESLYTENSIICYEANSCRCLTNKIPIINVSAPESPSVLPSVYQSVNANIAAIRKKVELKNLNNILTPQTINDCISNSSNADDLDLESATNWQLENYWKDLDGIFQFGHVERSHIHFDHYDIPERLLFRNKTAVHIEVKLKQFVWSYRHYIHYVIYPKDLTAAYLAHKAACKFLKKPIVAEARRLPNGYLALPDSVTRKLEGKNVMLVDDASNTGMTLRELIGLIELYRGKVLGIFTIINRTSLENEVTLRRLVPKISSAYKLNLEVFPRGNCPSCITLSRLEQFKENAGTANFKTYLQNRIKKNKVQDYERM